MLAVGAQPRLVELGVGCSQAPSVFRSIETARSGGGGTVPKEMVSSPLNPPLRFSK